MGRSKHKAYAYLLLPRHGRLFDTARRRIAAIRRYASLGAGFKLALRDLEIRGAGNLLGAEQSGHIAAVGFDLYCQLLRRTVARLKGETAAAGHRRRGCGSTSSTSRRARTASDRAAVLPADYIEDENDRLAFYRRIASCATSREVRALRAEMRDRFGAVPPAADRLLKIARARVLADRAGVQSVENRGDRLVLLRDGDPVAPGGRLPRLGGGDATSRLDAVLRALARAARER